VNNDISHHSWQVWHYFFLGKYQIGWEKQWAAVFTVHDKKGLSLALELKFCSDYCLTKL